MKSPGALRQLDERQAFEAMRTFLGALAERGDGPPGDPAALITSLARPADGAPADPELWRLWREAVANAGAIDAKPRLEPRQMGFFSEWYVVVTWPSGRIKKVNGFKTEAHARGWIEHNAAEWLANQKP